MNVLVVDDEIEILEILELIFEELGHKVIKAANGKEALEKIEMKQVDLMILDNSMPEMTGEEVLEQLYRNKKHDFKIIFASGQTMSLLSLVEENEHFMIVDYVLNKPFKIQNIKEALAELF